MLDRFKEILRTDYPEIESYDLYLAVSGGKDSMVLSHLLLRSGLDHTLLHCNFKLRGKESDEDEAFMRRYAEKSGLSIEVRTFDTYGYVEESGKTIQEAARELRYDWFHTFAENERSLILTAHHLDDSIETFFINLLRGTGYKGVRGIPKFNHPFYRPLSSFKADDIYRYIDENHIDYREDSSNKETKYLRNKLRHEIVPGFNEIEPKFRSKMGAFFEEMNNLESFVHQQVEELQDRILFHKDNIISAPIEELNKLNSTALHFVFREFGIRRSNVKAFIKFLQSHTGSKFFSETHEFLLDREFLLLKKLDISFVELTVEINEFPTELHIASKALRFEIQSFHGIEKTNNPLQLDLAKIDLPITIRNWKHGDKIQPLGMSGQKLISDVLIDHKISQFEKEKTLIIEDAHGKIIAIPNLMISEMVKSDDLTKDILLVIEE
ncbi:MAG: tRNA lysidine(34) synthetase TilS [Crocinitomicaceae bacterium]|nr:tRNA lysidine(34) synthetase TilS [Crocinitomicaceae bacterium]